MSGQPVLAVGNQLPEIRGETLDGEPFSTRQWYLRSSLVIVFMHTWPCEPCAAYLRALGDVAPDLEAERTIAVAVVPLERTLVLSGLPVERLVQIVLVDGKSVHTRVGLIGTGGEPVAAVLVVDETGTIWQAWSAEPDHRFPSPAEVVAWASHLAHQCPECWERAWWDEHARWFEAGES